jgi:hypothetical protein
MQVIIPRFKICSRITHHKIHMKFRETEKRKTETREIDGPAQLTACLWRGPNHFRSVQWFGGFEPCYLPNRASKCTIGPLSFSGVLDYHSVNGP